MVTLLYLAQEQVAVYDGGIRVNGKWLKKIRFFFIQALSSRPARLLIYVKGVRVNGNMICSGQPTCVWVNPRVEANSALSGNARYWVR